MEKQVNYEVADAVAVIALNRPDNMNAFTADLRADLAQALHDVANDNSVRVVVLTGKGNIRDSRVNASVVAERIIENLLGVPDTPDTIDDMSNALHDEFRARAQPLVDRALAGAKLSPERIAPILERVKRRWNEVGYTGDYRAWIEAHRPAS